MMTSNFVYFDDDDKEIDKKKSILVVEKEPIIINKLINYFENNFFGVKLESLPIQLFNKGFFIMISNKLKYVIIENFMPHNDTGYDILKTFANQNNVSYLTTTKAPSIKFSFDDRYKYLLISSLLVDSCIVWYRLKFLLGNHIAQKILELLDDTISINVYVLVNMTDKTVKRLNIEVNGDIATLLGIQKI